MKLIFFLLILSVASLGHCFKIYVSRSFLKLNGATIGRSSAGSLVAPMALRFSTNLNDQEGAKPALTAPVPKKYVHWNDEMDAALVHAIRDDKGAEWEDVPQWLAVAVRMQRKGYKITEKQCQNRWTSHLLPNSKGTRISGDQQQWTPEEVDQLCEMRDQGMRWCEIGAKLNIRSDVCSKKWKTAYVQNHWVLKRELPQNLVDMKKKKSE